MAVILALLAAATQQIIHMTTKTKIILPITEKIIDIA